MGSVSVRTHFGRRVAVRARRAFSELAHEERTVPSGPVPPVGWDLKKSGWWSPKLQQQGLEVWRARSFGGGEGEVFGAALSRRGDPGRWSAEELEEAGLAVGLARALLEGALGERAQAEGAGEVVRVEAAAQGRHASAGHREATRGAQRPAPSVEMVLAERTALVLEKAASREGRETFLGKGNREKKGQRQLPNQITPFWS